MRKLYALLAGLAFFFFASVPAHAGTRVPDVANFTFAINPGNNVAFTNTSILGNEPGIRRAYWSFGDGNGLVTGPLDNAQHHYTAPGTFNVCLKIYRFTTNVGDSVLAAEICKTLVIQAATCEAGFQVVPSPAGVIGTYFQALPAHSQNKKPVLICWNFGDGTDTCIQYSTTYTGLYGAFHHYLQPGTYNVCVTITYDGGCQAQNCHAIIIPPPTATCQAGFEVLSTASNSLGKYFVAIPGHSQNKKPVQVCWTFGDGRDTCIQYATTFTGQYATFHAYSQPGTYNVCVKILYDGGCLAENCRPVVVAGPDSCRADFERGPVAGTNSPLNATFNAIPWHSNNKKPVQVCWNFGDNTDTCIQYSTTSTGPYSVFHHYNNPGTYNVCVKITYDGGCFSYKCKPVVVGVPDSCRADFERIAATPGTNPLTVIFKALPFNSNNQKPGRICWNFGDGTDTCITYLNIYNGTYTVPHTYRFPGAYNVCVKITYYGGCEAYKCKLVQVGQPDSCGADFERIPLNSNIPLQVGFNALPQHNNNRKPMRVCWNFGDNRDTCINYGQDYTGLYTVAHRYEHGGTYNVCVKITYYGGCEAYKCKPIILPEPPPTTCTARLVEITPSITSLVRGFLANPDPTPNHRPVRVCYYFGDGTDTCILVSLTQPLPIGGFFMRHTYPAAGVYRACVKILYYGGCIAEDCREVVIRGASNLCGGFVSDSLVGPRTYLFRGHSIHAPNDNPISFTWSFGDGTSQNGQNVTHTYNQPGDYRVCLLIRTQLGCETRICESVRVPGNNEPALHLAPNPVVNVLHVQFFSTHTETVNVRIVNPYGVQVRVYTRAVTTGNNNWDLDLSTLPSGVYTFAIQSPNQLASAIFFKQ